MSATNIKSIARRLAKAMPKTAAYIEEDGWEIVGMSGDGHVLLDKDGQRRTTVPNTPGDRKSDLFVRTRLRRKDTGMTR